MILPTVICGPVSIAHAAITREIVDLQKVVDAAGPYLHAALQLLGSGKDTP